MFQTDSKNLIADWICETQAPFLDQEHSSVINRFGNCYIGTIGFLPITEEIERARKFFHSNSYFGYRLGKNMLTLSPTNLSKNLDLYFTDCNGVLKTDIEQELSALELARQAKSEKKPVIAFFGGSTMMGDGSRSPRFTIAAQVEKLLSLKFGIQTCCVNFGIAGSSSIDALNILDSEVLSQYCPDKVIFYDGWNCSTQFIFKAVISEFPSLRKKIEIYDRQSLFSIVHDLYIAKAFNIPWLLRYFLTVLTIQMLSKAIRFFKNKNLISFFTNCAKRLPVFYGKQAMFRDIYHGLFIENVAINSVVNHAAQSYIRVHEAARKHCEIEGVQFLSFFQPHQDLGKKTLTDLEKQHGKDAQSLLVLPETNRSFHRELREKLFSKPNYFDLTDCFDQVEDEVYIDDGHINRYGNYLVADRIAETIYQNLSHKNFSATEV
jgi:hypothetical protein